MAGSVCLYAAALPFSVSGATLAWILLAASLFVVLREEKRSPNVRVSGLEWMLAAYLAVGLLSAIFGVDPTRSLGRLRGDANMVWIACLFAAAFVIEPVPQAPLAAAFGMAAAALVGIGRAVFVTVSNGKMAMAKGTVYHITFGELMAFAVAGGVSAWVFSDSSVFKGKKPWIAAFSALVVVALLLSQARGPWLACLAALGTIALLRADSRKFIAAGIASVVLLLIAARPLLERFQSIFNKGQDANATRLELWNLALTVFKERPLLGAGPDNFATRIKELHPGPFPDTLFHTQTHNVYLAQLSERGLVGLAMLLTLLGFLWWKSVQRYLRQPEFSSLWLLAAFNAFLVMNLTENSLQKATVWMFVVFLWVWTMRGERSADS